MASRQGACVFFNLFIGQTPTTRSTPICAFCFLPSATAENRADLHRPERAHQCMKAIVQQHEVTKSPGGLKHLRTCTLGAEKPGSGMPGQALEIAREVCLARHME